MVSAPAARGAGSGWRCGAPGDSGTAAIKKWPSPLKRQKSSETIRLKEVVAEASGAPGRDFIQLRGELVDGNLAASQEELLRFLCGAGRRRNRHRGFLSGITRKNATQWDCKRVTSTYVPTGSLSVHGHG